jgi:2-polyprenyl-3-methyl-5-hydroxy-6-metoxy-1,4-benzoquinol methylase
VDQNTFYSEISGLYDVMIDWDKRLKREGPFFRKIFQERGVAKILDSAAAGGRHVRYFKTLGYAAHGSDFCQDMIDECRRGDPGHAADYIQADFRNLAAKVFSPYDAVLCLGCSLPHLRTVVDFSKALANFVAILKPGGILITQFVNFDKVRSSDERVRPLNHTIRPEGEYFFLRVYDLISESRMIIHLNTLIKRGMEWEWKVLSTTLFPILTDHYRELLAQAGFSNIKYYGDYAFSPFDKKTSADLIVVAESPH